MNKIDKDTIKNPFWAMSISDSLATLKTSRLGLSEKDVLERRTFFGENKIITPRRFVKLKILIRQFKSPLIYILLLAGFVTLFLGDINDFIFIFIAVSINTALGFYQENKAEKSLEGLSGYIKKRAIVSRWGEIKEIDVEDLVPGDIINFSSGDNIPADGRIIYSNNLVIDEAILTGEALSEEKNTKSVGLKTVLGDRKSMVFSGTSVVDGVGSAVVSLIGKDTELGAMASLMTSIKDEITPLQKTINSFANKLALLVILLSSVIFFLGQFYGYSLLQMFTMSVAIAVAAIPEDLAVAMTVILAVGVERLAKRKGVVRKLLSAETLGDTSVILTDKTGTLTEARMNLSKIEIPFMEDDTLLKEKQKIILKFAILCTDSRVENPNAPIKDWKITGKPLDRAIITGAASYFGLNEFEIRKKVITEDRLPFNSQNKFSAIKIRENSEKSILMIGAPEVVLKFCSYFYWNKDEFILDEKKSIILKDVHKAALEGHRIISVAMLEGATDLKNVKNLNNFLYLGNILLKDTVRSGIGQVVGEIEKEGIRTVIVTGDHTGTAISVAKEIGMKIEKDSVMEQHELDLIDDEELGLKMPNIKIFSRINPLSKVRIVKFFQKLGQVVAMTGDGVNDAPALKQADIGIAIGSGSGVAIESSDLVLLDDSFHTIVSAIDEGRRILQNIRKVLVFCLADLFDELLLVGGSIIFNLPLPLNAAQILWVNFVTDSLPTISLSYEDEISGGRVIRQKVSRKSVFDKEVKFLVWVIGTLTSILLFALHIIMIKIGIEENLARTFIFASFGIYTLMLIFSVRSLDKNIWEYNPFSNWFTNISSIVGLLLMLVAIYFPPAQALLDTVSLPLFWFFFVFGVGFSCMAMVEIGKFIFIRKTLAR